MTLFLLGLAVGIVVTKYFGEIYDFVHSFLVKWKQ